MHFCGTLELQFPYFKYHKMTCVTVRTSNWKATIEVSWQVFENWNVIYLRLVLTNGSKIVNITFLMKWCSSMVIRRWKKIMRGIFQDVHYKGIENIIFNNLERNCANRWITGGEPACNYQIAITGHEEQISKALICRSLQRK